MFNTPISGKHAGQSDAGDEGEVDTAELNSFRSSTSPPNMQSGNCCDGEPSAGSPGNLIGKGRGAGAQLRL